MNWSEEVTALIAESGKTIQEAADAAGVPKRTIENWKYGKAEPNDFTKKTFRKEIKKMKLRKRKISNLFDELGIEEIWQKNYLVNEDEYRWHKEDFSEGGKMEKFKDYTIERFEDEFYCTIWVC